MKWRKGWMTHKREAAELLFTGKSEMAMRMRSHDWSQTPLGSVETWSPSLRSALSICLNSRFPIAIYWGQDFILLYNDAWRPIVGDKHSWALGHPAREVWSEIWDDIGSELAGVLATGEGTFHQDDLLSMHRFGYTEECFFEYTFNPIQGEGGGTDGVFNVVSETTYRVLNDRRARLLREVASKTGIAKTAEASCKLMLEAFRFDRLDIPLALLYLIDSEGKYACLCNDIEFNLDSSVSPATIDLTVDDDFSGWQIARAVRTARPQEIDDLVSRFGVIPGSPWTEPPEEAMVLPIVATAGGGKVSGVLVAVASPRRRLDEQYRNFFTQIAGQVALAIANARAYEEESKRAEALAEIDRAKTVFFSNVSHEFRTPLTLMLSPLEELSGSLSDRLQADEREQIQLVQRNGLRLQKLVNTLLDFSRIEAGRVQASYEPIDLATYTAELASTFRSLIERANMELTLDCPPLSEPVYVDREMWEKIVFNLLSNGFKFTFSGSITVRLRSMKNRVELVVKDTGVGIPKAELPKLFARFHRVSGTRSRTYEGSGIGLSLVQELVKLHQGAIEVTSIEEEGSCFTVTIPKGTNHLPQDRIGSSRTLASTALGANAYLEEALRWLPETNEGEIITLREGELCSPSLRKIFPFVKILVADDNADMRDYLRRLLSQQYEVEAVSDGLAALTAVRQQLPDLILTDLMMPNLDGFGLLQALRNDPQTREIPIILLSARAGEESRIEGLEAGADDYLTKPFSARELLTRVEASLKLAQLRREAGAAIRESEEKYRTLFESIDQGFCIIETIFDENDRPIDYRFLITNPAFDKQTGKSNVQGKTVLEIAPQHEDYWFEIYGNVAVTGEPIRFENRAEEFQRWYEVYAFRIGEPELKRVGILFNDISDRKQIELERQKLLQREQALRSSAESAEAKLNELLESIREDFVSFDSQWRVAYLNPQAAITMRMNREAILGKNFWDLFPDLVGTEFYDRLHRVRRARTPIQFEYYYPIWDCWFENRVYPTSDGVVNLSTNITERKQAELMSREQNRLLEKIAAGTPLEECLSLVCISIAKLKPGTKTCFLLTDANCQTFSRSVMPNLPPSFGEGLKDAPINDLCIGTCGEAVYRGQPISCADIANDDRWSQGWRELCIAHGILACHSQPVMDRKDLPLGSLMLCFNEARQPTDWEYRLVNFGTQVASILFERDRSIQALHQSEERYRALTELSPQLVFMSRPDGFITYCNQWGLEFTGRSLDRLQGDGWAECIHPDERDRIYNVWMKATREVSDYDIEIPFRRADGEYRWLYTRALPVTEESGEIAYWIGISLDITDRKQIEAEREQLLTREQAAREAAEQANRIKDEFLAVLSHELRSPLNPILGWAKLLQSGKLDAAKTAQALATIERNAKLQADLIEDLLDVSRILRGKLNLNISSSDLASIIQAALETVRLAAESKSIQIEVNLDSVGQVSGDPTRLQQVFWNLLSNAVKFTPAGGKVEVRLEQSESRKEDIYSPSLAQIVVSDTGKGIHPDFVPHVFDYFRQEDGATTRKFGGLGLGLAIVRHLVELHGGTVAAASEGEGKGATFTVKLPLMPIESNRDFDRPASKSPLDLNGLRVLLIDDEIDSREFVAFVLEQEGASVTAVSTASEGFLALTKSPPDVLLSDIGMPDMDGYMLMRQVRALPPERGGQVKAIALTAYAGDFNQQQALQVGFQKHLSKPVEIDALVRAIVTLTRGS
jgi:PAS domain S-box-containing protein